MQFPRWNAAVCHKQGLGVGAVGSASEDLSSPNIPSQHFPRLSAIRPAQVPHLTLAHVVRGSLYQCTSSSKIFDGRSHILAPMASICWFCVPVLESSF